MEDNRIELEKRGAVKFRAPQPEDSTTIAVPPSADTTVITIVGDKVTLARRAAPSTRTIYFDFKAEIEAYHKAHQNLARTRCLKTSLDLKIAIENALGIGIVDAGNVRDSSLCTLPLDNSWYSYAICVNELAPDPICAFAEE